MGLGEGGGRPAGLLVEEHCRRGTQGLSQSSQPKPRCSPSIRRASTLRRVDREAWNISTRPSSIPRRVPGSDSDAPRGKKELGSD